MGQLSQWMNQQGAGVGQAFTPGGGAQGAAQAGMGAGFLGMNLNEAGIGAGALGQFNEYKYAAEVAHQNADSITRTGMINANLTATRYGELANKQTAQFAGQGVGLTSPSAQRVVQGTEDTGRLAAAMARYDYERQAWGKLAEAANYKAAATNSLVKGAFDEVGGFLTGAGALSGKWQQYAMTQGAGGSGQTMGVDSSSDLNGFF